MRWQQAPFDPTRRRRGRLPFEQLPQWKRTVVSGAFFAAALIGAPCRRASNKMASSTTEALRSDPNRRAVRAKLIDFPQDASCDLIQRLTGVVIEWRLRHTGGFELMGEVGVAFFARHSFHMIIHANTLAQRFLQVRGESPAQRRAGR